MFGAQAISTLQSKNPTKSVCYVSALKESDNISHPAHMQVYPSLQMHLISTGSEVPHASASRMLLGFCMRVWGLRLARFIMPIMCVKSDG